MTSPRINRPFRHFHDELFCDRARPADRDARQIRFAGFGVCDDRRDHSRRDQRLFHAPKMAARTDAADQSRNAACMGSQRLRPVAVERHTRSDDRLAVRGHVVRFRRRLLRDWDPAVRQRGLGVC